MKNIHGREQLEIQLSNELAIQEIVQISKSGLIDERLGKRGSDKPHVIEHSSCGQWPRLYSKTVYSTD